MALFKRCLVEPPGCQLLRLYCGSDMIFEARGCARVDALTLRRWEARITFYLWPPA
ncbi:hypothetical protein WG66_004107 [Moniliophthora roreri]|nr:hypothetical protein WG66_004107 [Moniliophthora roreri]